ncbi:MAG: HPr family phosphocarrier protein [Rhodospirillaceae bacterium]|nr:HPr family phosphocarrier protein [Rhodospirillaceae bacterium]MCY4239977.1 HPr family phosphocarrier protein [Rhodospirillaceae bacterium]
MATATVEIVNRKGLHARAAAAFAKTSRRFRCIIKVSRGGTTVSGDSIMGLMMLSAAKGTTIDIATEGDDADEAQAALLALVAEGFGEGSD